MLMTQIICNVKIKPVVRMYVGSWKNLRFHEYFQLKSSNLKVGTYAWHLEIFSIISLKMFDVYNVSKYVHVKMYLNINVSKKLHPHPELISLALCVVIT